MITDSAGKVAVRYYQAIPKSLTYGDDTYDFVVRGNVSMAWVKPEHLQAVLAIHNPSCNCGQGNHVFRLATAQWVNLWEGRPARDGSRVYA